MKKFFKRYGFLLALGLLALTSATVLFWTYHWRSLSVITSQELLNPPASLPAVRKVDLAKLEQNYGASVKTILAKYDSLMAEPAVLAAESDSVSRPDPKALRPLLDELLGLVVPSEYKDFHLGLSIAWTRLAETGVEQSLRQDYVKRVESLRTEAKWLTGQRP